MKTGVLCAAICVAAVAVGQTPPPTQSSEPAEPSAKTRTSAKHDVGSGAGDIGKGAAKGTRSAAKGTAKAAVDLVTLHPVNAATDLGKGAANTGRNVGTGAAKGTAKMLEGAGKALKHLF